jgi:ABC-type molybdenum transport system ATPase subunit/photorepair protein PhrA
MEHELDDLNGLRARLTPGALRFALADPAQAEALRAELPKEGLAWVGWGRRQALLAMGRPSAQERYSSMAGKDAPLLGDWLAEAFRRWRPGPGGVAIQAVSWARVDRAVRLCRLEPFTERPVSLLSNGEVVRACLAHALGEQPKLLVMDDLCEGLDQDGRALLMELATNVAAEGAAVLVLATRESLLPWADPGEVLAAPSAPPGKGPLLFSTRGLRLDAGDLPLVHGLDWDIHGGEAWWLQGPNGAGKSTLLAYLSGEHPQAWAQAWELEGAPRSSFCPLSALRHDVAWVSPELAAALGKPVHVSSNRISDYIE